MYALRLTGLSIGYGSRAVQSGLDICAGSGQMICLLGTNGCGKSTLLRTLAGLQSALRGSVTAADGSDLLAMSEKERSRRVSVVLTDRLSADRTTVHDIAAMGRYPYTPLLGRLGREDERVVAEALEQTGMSGKRDCFFNELSDGEKQRTLIAKALAQQTPVILLDEPTAHLDLPNRIKTLLMLRHLAHSAGRTVIISTHELTLALQTADTIWLMLPDNGIRTGPPDELVADGTFAKAFEDSHFRFVNAGGTLKLEIIDQQS